MYWDVKKIIEVSGCRMTLLFEDGSQGVLDLENDIERDEIYASLRNRDVFNSVLVQDGFLVWPGDLDIAPETVYSRATGRPLPEWMNRHTETM